MRAQRLSRRRGAHERPASDLRGRVSSPASAFAVMLRAPSSADETVNGGLPATRLHVVARSASECHPQVYAEWEASPHANSWINEAVRSLSNDFANTGLHRLSRAAAASSKRWRRRAHAAAQRAPRRGCRLPHVPHSCPRSKAVASPARSLDSRSRSLSPDGAKIELSTRPEFCAGCHNQHKTVRPVARVELASRTKIKGCRSTATCPIRDGDARDAGREPFADARRDTRWTSSSGPSQLSG